VDGKETFEAIYEALLAAKSEIFMADWFMVSEILLKRGEGSTLQDKLDVILEQKVRFFFQFEYFFSS
jgi:phosphatidylserine/phosphatidylglycerophosphate/cardiolipin synthase-like enzyme